MAIRVLCLHGMGTDSTILKAQITPFLSMLPPGYSFYFPDAPVLCDPSPGVTDVYAGPYRCWFNTPTNFKVAKAHAQIRKLVRNNGGKPFDVVIGFSQGASLAASMLLRQQIEHPEQTPLFKAAMFICSPLPFSCTPYHGIDVRKYFGVDASVTPSAVAKRPTTVPDYLVAEEYFLRNDKDIAGVARGFEKADDESEESWDSMKEEKGEEEGGEGGPYYNMLHPTVDKFRIRVPTAHVYGRKDSWRGHSMDLMGLCDSKKCVKFEHDGGHEVPRSASEEMCDLFEELMARAGLL